MTRPEFETLRDLPDKEIIGDIEVQQKKNSLIYSSRPVPVANELGYEVQLNVHHHPHVAHWTFNFSVKGVGAVCRYDINGTIHGNAGRTHKQTLMTERCPVNGLPHAVARPDLDKPSLTLEDIWSIVCNEAKVLHTGRIIVR